MKKIFYTIIFSLNILSAQPSDYDDYYHSALAALNSNDTLLAKKLFEKSIRQEKNPESYFELSKILLENKTPSNSYKAQKYLKRAILISENDIKYRLKLAEAVESRYPMYAYDIYRDIIEIESSNLTAWERISKIKEIECRELSRIADVAFDEDLSLIKSTDIYQETLAAVKKVLSIDKDNEDAKARLSLLYSYAGEYNKAIKVLKNAFKEESLNLDGMLYLGFLYCRGNKFEKASEVYSKALELMGEEERAIFTSESIHEIFFDDMLKKFGLEEDDETKEFIASYVKSKDPLYLTEYNERMLEHFTRLVYANLHFSIPRMNIRGWNSDRGEIFIRYGYPGKITQVNSTINMTDLPSNDFSDYESFELVSFGNNFVKAEIWDYGNLSLAFESLFMNGNYVFNNSPPFLGPTGRFAPKSPINMDTQLLVEGGLRKMIPDDFTPSFEGPIFEVNHNSYQMKNFDNNKTDIYVNYAIDKRDGVVYNNKFAYRHKYGVFLFDDLFNPIFETRNSLKGLELDNKITIDNKYTFFVNTVPLNIEPDSGNFAFELIRLRDKGVSAYKSDFKAKDFSGESLMISDIILAANINNAEHEGATIKRNEIEILPNPTNAFSGDTPLYIYYEVYNLELYEDNFTNFEQEITIKEYEEESSGIVSAVNSFLDVIGVKEEKKKITLLSSYRTSERNPQVYLELDMNEYNPGLYVLEIKITDKLKKQNVTNSTFLYWR